MKVMLARKYDGQDPAGYWMSEKLDGVRAIWNGKDFISRNGKVFNAPPWFRKGMPRGVMLDGELWQGRGKFQSTVGAVRSKRGDWQDIKYMVFDLVDSAAYEDRREALTSLTLPCHCQVLEQTRCKGRLHLLDFESHVLSKGGEGVILRKPHSKYEHRRSSSLLKVKRFRCAEAVVVGYEPGKGKHHGRLGALVCKFAGDVFRLGTGITDAMRECPPAIGEVVTFRFFEFTPAGMPRFPSFVGLRDYE